MGAVRRDVAPVEARNPEIGFLLGLLQAGTQNARRELGDMPEEALVWQPYPNGHSIGAILLHLAGCEAGWLHEVAAEQEGVGDLETELMEGHAIDQYGGIWPAPPNRSLAWYYARQDEVRARTIELVRELPQPGALRIAAWSPGRAVTVRWILHHIIEHEAYHAGQAVLLSLIRERVCGA